MSVDQSAIDALKEKIAQFKAASSAKDELEFHAPDADLIALANVGNGKAAHYVWHSINIDWNPLDHPRDPNTGQFAETPGGYIFGKAKKAKFKGNLVANNVELGPGDVAFKTNLGNVLISHPDGSYTLHHKQDGKHKVSKVPAGAVSKIAQMSQDGELEKIGENPGVSVPAKSKTEAAFKLENPTKGVPHDLPKDTQTTNESAWDVEKPTLKNGKTAFTAKQYAEYQESIKGLPMGTTADGTPIKAGDWVDIEGKPYLIYPSPHGDFEDGHYLSVYRWVSTKQQASNLVKEDLFTSNDFPDMKVIPDPTGKPYGKDLGELSTDAPKAGALMSQAAAVAIPNTSTAHKKHVENSKGKVLTDASNVVLGDLNGKAIASGDWMQIDGKPVQVHDSPNEGFVAIAKWVGTKQQASNNTYDFPEEVVGTGVVIPDPTGKPYTPVAVEKKATGSPAAKKAVSKPPAPKVDSNLTTVKQASAAEAPVGTVVKTWTGSIYQKTGDDEWMPKGSTAKNGKPAANTYGNDLFNSTYLDGTILDSLPENLNADPEPDEPTSDEDFGALLPTTSDGQTQAEVADQIDNAKPLSTIVIASSVQTGSPVIQAIFVKQDDGFWKDSLGGWSNVSDKSLKSVILHDDPNVADPSMEYFALNTTFAGEDPDFPGLKVYSEQWFDSVPNGSIVTENSTPNHPTDTPIHNTFVKTDEGWKHQITSSIVPSSVFANAFENPTSDWWAYAYTSAEDVPSSEQESDGGWSEKDKHDAEVMGQIGKGYIGDTLALQLANGGAATYEKTNDDEWKLQVYSGPDGAEPPNTLDEWHLSTLVGESMGATYEVNPPEDVELPPVFVHPASGATFELGPTDIVFKNKKVADSWIIYAPDKDAENPYNYFTSTGKLQKPKASHKGFEDNYEADENYPGSHEAKVVPATGYAVKDASEVDNAPTGTVLTEDAVHNADTKNSYIKQENGFWKATHTSWEGPIDGSSIALSNYYTYTIYPPGTHEQNQDFLPVAAPEAEVKPVKKGKKALPKEDLPTEFTFPNGKKIALKPGEVLIKADIPEGYSNGPTTYYIIARPGAKTYNQFFSKDGDGLGSVWSLSQTTPSQFKQYIKGTTGFQTAHGAASFEMVADKPVLKVEATDFSVFDPGTTIKEFSGLNGEDDFYNTHYAYLKVKNKWFDPITTNLTYYNGNFYGGGSIPKANPTDEDPTISWGQSSIEDKMTYLASMEEIAGKGVALMKQADDFTISDKSQKAKATKYKNSLINAHRFTQIAKAFLDPDVAGWDDDRFEQELSWAEKVTNSKAANFSELRKVFPVEGFYQAFLAADAQRKFKNSLTGLGFDPYNATTEEFDKYAKEKGFTALPALDFEQQKLWVLDSIGDPSLSSGQKTNAKNLAQAAQTKLNIATFAETVDKNDAAFKAEESGTKGAAIKSQLKKSYTLTTASHTVTFKYLSPNEWEWKIKPLDGGDEISQPNANDGIVSAVVNASLSNGDDVETSDALAYGPITDINEAIDGWLEGHGVKDKTLTTFGGTNEEVEAAVVAAGANFPKVDGGIPSVTLKRWIRYEVEGDYIGQYALEAKLYGDQPHPKELSHPGSPQSPIGQVAHKALAVHALQHAEGIDWLTGNAVYWNELAEHLGVSNIDASWKAEHDFSVIAAFTAGSSEYGTANKPVDVSANVWGITNSLEPNSDYATLLGNDWAKFKNMDEATLDQSLTSNGKSIGYNSLTVPAIPLHLKKVAVWGLGANSQESERKQFASAIIAKAKAGEFLTDKTPVWISPNGEKYPISPGGQVWKSGEDSFMLTGPAGPNGKPSSGFSFVTGQAAPQNVSGYTLQDPQGYGWEHVFTMPNPITWEKAKADNPGLDQLIYDLSEKIEEGQAPSFSHHLSGPLLTAELKKNDTLKEKYPNLYANHKNLPEHVRQAVQKALESDNGPLLMLMDYKAQAGHYASMQSKGLFDGAQPWIPHLSKGQLDTDAVLNHWTPEAKDAFVSYFKLQSHDEIAPRIDAMLNPEQVVISKALPKLEDLQLTWVKDKTALGGMHSGGIWVDQDGNEWMTKGFASDPNGPARVDAEDAANKIAILYGFDAPTTYAVKLGTITSGKDNKYSYLQHLKPAKGDFAGKSVKDLTTKQLQQAMSEHVVDWITSNHDTHSQNLMLTPEGRVFGIDKGQAFKHFPNDKLAHGYLPPENGAPVWYDQFYNALKNGQISKEDADEVTKYVLRSAQKISKDKDEEYRELLNHALKNRQNFPDQFPTKEQFIDALVERKHNTFNDFVSFYEGLYKQSPYEWDIDPENLTPPSLGEGQVHIAVSQAYADDVVKANAYGKALFFDSKDLEDSHITFSKVTGSNGKQWLTGEAKIRANGDKKLTEWLQKQTVEHKTSPSYNYNSKQGYAYYEDGPNYEEMPQSNVWFSSMVSYSKTVSHHNKEGDQSYNAGTVATAEAVKKQLDNAKNIITDHKKNNPDKPFAGSVSGEVSDNGNGSVGAFAVNFVTLEQQDAWLAQVETYLGYYQKVKEKEGTSEKVTPHFTQPVYTASDAAKKAALGQDNPDMPKSSLDAPVGTVVKSGSHTYTKTDDETWKNAQGTDFSIQALQDAWKYMSLETLGEPDDETPAEDEDVVTAEVTVGTKVLKVTYRPAASKAGVLNTATNEFTASDSEISNFDFGNMYEIDFGNTVVEYRPWHGSDVAPAQQGLLKFRKKDWEGDDASIDEILDVMRHMGLDLDPASEESMELFYYRHLFAQIGDRKEKDGSTKYGTAYKAIQADLQGKPDLSNSEELAIHKAAWTNALGADVVEKIDWLPKFSRMRPQVSGETSADDDNFPMGTGKPYWTRPVTSYKDLKSIYGNGSKLPMSSMHSTGDSLKVAKSGTYMSSEERYRVLSQGFKSGMSSHSDATSHSSSAVVYIRQGLSFSDSGYEAAFYHPRILMRTHNYAFSGDSYGDNDQKKSSHWDIKAMSKFTGGGNELMVKNAVSVLDDILFLKFYSEADRQEAIQYYKGLGITMIHGIPIEKLFRTNMNDSEVKQITQEIWDKLVEEEASA